MLLKISAMGFWFNEDAYIKDSWNQLDFIIVMSAFLDSFTDSDNINSLRALRVLRPLRSVSRI